MTVFDKINYYIQIIILLRGVFMIILTKLDGMEFSLNCDLIETVYSNPDTTIHLTNGRLYIVKETIQQVIDKSVVYHQETFKNILNSKF